MERDRAPAPVPPRGDIPADALAALRDSLLRHIEHPSSHNADLREALARIAREARERNVPPERLLVQLHTVWDEILDACGALSRDDRRELRGRMVAICIDHYYAIGLAMCAVGALFRAAG